LSGPGLRLAIVDDHQMVLSGLEAWIGHADGGVEVVITAASWADLLDHPAFPVDVVLLDLDLGDGIPASLKISTLRQAGVATVIISTLAEPARIRACLAAGAAGYLPKTEPADEILRAVTTAATGEGYMTPSLAALLVADREDDAENAPALSPQELRALVLYASGLPMKSVARRLGVSAHTAKGYVDRVREKYAQAGRQARTKLDLHRRAVEDGLLTSAARDWPGLGSADSGAAFLRGLSVASGRRRPSTGSVPVKGQRA
jgi:two-component system uhpT operon response regulator UhpA